nr:hypothetical protein [Tanacetum cinerariifolium]
MMRPNHQDPNALDNMKPVEEVLLPQVHHEFLLWEGCNRDAKSRYNTRLAQLLPRHIYLPCVVHWDVLNRMGCDGEIDDMLRIRLGLYQAVDLEEEGCNVYFEGGLRSDEHFNAYDYWLSISCKENLGLSMSHTSTIRNPILRVIHKMITYSLCQRTTGYDKIQKNDLWVLIKDVVRSLNASIYCRDLDTITLRYLIDSDGKIIPVDPQMGVPRAGIPRPPRAFMQDLYERMEIRQEAIERIEYRQSYPWDRYQGVFEHMAEVYSFPLHGAYNPRGYAQPQYDQYYQQYPPLPPQYQQQQ